MPLIQISNITKQYIVGEETLEVLHGVSLTVEKGEFVAIMGPSGSGKSTLMHILSFLDTPTTGQYLFDGIDASTMTPDELAQMRNQKIGFVFQSFNLLPRTSVYDNVALPLLYSSKSGRSKFLSSDEERIGEVERQHRNSTAPNPMPTGRQASLSKEGDKSVKDQVTQAIHAVGLEHRVNNLSNQLSGGEKQRVAIARAIVNNPEVIFADEPTGNLDSKRGNEIMQILQDMNDAGRTIIMVTHEADTAAHAKRIVKIKDGLIVSDEKVIARRLAREGELVK